jgi:hypothetical protein
LKEIKVSVTDFQYNLLCRLVGLYSPSLSGVVRYIILHWIGGSNELAEQLKRFEEWKQRKEDG